MHETLRIKSNQPWGLEALSFSFSLSSWWLTSRWLPVVLPLPILTWILLIVAVFRWDSYLAQHHLPTRFVFGFTYVNFNECSKPMTTGFFIFILNLVLFSLYSMKVQQMKVVEDQVYGTLSLRDTQVRLCGI